MNFIERNGIAYLVSIKFFKFLKRIHIFDLGDSSWGGGIMVLLSHQAFPLPAKSIVKSAEHSTYTIAFRPTPLMRN